MRVPICTPSAPSANAAAMVRPSQMPPAAITGTSTCEHTSGISTIDATSRWFLKPPPSPPSATMPSTPASIAFSAAWQVGHHVEHGDAGVVQRVGEAVRVTGRRGDEPHALVVHEVDDAGIAHERLRDVHAERLVGEVAHLGDLVAHLVEPARRRLDDPERARVRHRRRQLRPGDVAHRRLDDRVLDAQQLGDSVQHPAHATEVARPASRPGQPTGYLGAMDLLTDLQVVDCSSGIPGGTAPSCWATPAPT